MSNRDMVSSKKTDAVVVEHAISAASQTPSVQNAENDQTCTGVASDNAPLPIRVYSPLSCKSIREQFGVSLQNLARSFDPSSGAVGSGGVTEGGNSRHRVWGRSTEDLVIVSKSGHYIAQAITEKQLKLISIFVERMKDHIHACPGTLLPRFYFVFSIKVARSRNFEHWVITDNINRVPLSIIQRYDLKGCPFSRKTSAANAAKGEVLKDGNVEEVTKGCREFPSVNPLHSRHLLDVLSEDFAFLEGLNLTNYSAFLIVSPAKGEEQEISGPILRSLGPNKPPFIRMGGPKRTLFVSIVDVLHEFTVSNKFKSAFNFFRGPAKAKAAKGAAPKEYSARLLAFLNESLQEHRADNNDINWSHEVRTKASLMFISPGNENHTSLEGVSTPKNSELPPPRAFSDPAASAQTRHGGSLTFPFRRRKTSQTGQSQSQTRSQHNDIEPKAAASKKRIEPQLPQSAPQPAATERWWEVTPDSDAPAQGPGGDTRAPIPRRLFNQRTPPPTGAGPYAPSQSREISQGPEQPSRVSGQGTAGLGLELGAWAHVDSSPLPSPKHAG